MFGCTLQNVGYVKLVALSIASTMAWSVPPLRSLYKICCLIVLNQTRLVYVFQQAQHASPHAAAMSAGAVHRSDAEHLLQACFFKKRTIRNNTCTFPLIVLDDVDIKKSHTDVRGLFKSANIWLQAMNYCMLQCTNVVPFATTNKQQVIFVRCVRDDTVFFFCSV